MPDFTLTAKPNRYSGKCVGCGEQVFANKGVLGKSAAGKWIVAHSDALCYDGAPAPEPILGPPAPRTIAERIEIAKRNGNSYVDSYVARVERAATYEEARKAISDASQGMTMDYMTEYSREATAVEIARDLADERFAPVSV
jgi:hypothetical protein